MTRAVLDTNVLVSALIKSNGTPGRILDAHRLGRYELVASAELLDELERVLLRPRILRLVHATREEVSAFVRRLASSCVLAEPGTEIRRASRDP